MSAWTAAQVADRRCDLARRDLRAGAPLHRAAAYALAAQQTPALVLAASWVLSLLRDGVRPAHVRAALADALAADGTPFPPAEVRSDTAQLLRAAAAGRREYAQSCTGQALAEMNEALLHDAGVLEFAARVAEGDLGPLYGWLPSWRWTDEMTERIAEDFTARPDPAEEP